MNGEPLGIRPLKGFCFVEPELTLEEVAGTIVIPKSVISDAGRGDYGTVIAEAPIENDLSGLVGRRVLVASWTGQQFIWNGRTIRRVHLDQRDIVGICYEGVWVSSEIFGRVGGREAAPGESGVARCRTCRSAGEGNIILDSEGYCQSCGRNVAGSPKPKPTIVENAITGERKKIHTTSLTEEERNLYGGAAPSRRGHRKFFFSK